MVTLITVVPIRPEPGNTPTGPIGRHLAGWLLAAGERVRVLAPASELAGWPQDVEVVAGDVTRPADSPGAFTGVDRLFLAGAIPATVPELLEIAGNGGVRRIVVLSSHGPEFEIDQPPETSYLLAIERAVEASAAEWTHVRPSAVMASLLVGGYPATGASWAQTIRAGQVIREPYIHAAYPFVDEDDVAAVATAALLDNRYAGRVVEAAGLAISAAERVQILGDALGRTIPLEELTPEQARKLWRDQGWPEETIEVTLGAQEWFLTHPGEHEQWRSQQDPTVEQMIGRPPRTFADWVTDHLQAFR